MQTFKELLEEKLNIGKKTIEEKKIEREKELIKFREKVEKKLLFAAQKGESSLEITDLNFDEAQVCRQIAESTPNLSCSIYNLTLYKIAIFTLRY